MNLYLDASALVKRYIAEPGTNLLRDVMEHADGWFMCRVGFVETARAVAMAGGVAGLRAVRDEWPAFAVVEVDQALAEHAVTLALDHGLRSLDALHLAAALILPHDTLVIATWDRRLHAAAAHHDLRLVPDALE